MPLYEFTCKKCGNKLEQLCKMGETGTELVCPHCGSRGLRRLVSGFASPGVKGGQDKCAGCSGGNCSNC
jgi:putative FmdB family regulatory protein